MFRKIAAFELRYQLTSPVFWVAFGIFFLLTFGATTVPHIQIGSAGNVEYTWNDSPTQIPTGTIGPTDNFTLKFTYYWRSSTGTDTKMYAGGTLTLSDYQAVWSPRTLGFTGVSYDHVIVKGIEQVSPGTYQYGPTITINGGYRATFAAQ